MSENVKLSECSGQSLIVGKKGLDITALGGVLVRTSSFWQQRIPPNLFLEGGLPVVSAAALWVRRTVKRFFLLPWGCVTSVTARGGRQEARLLCSQEKTVTVTRCTSDMTVHQVVACALEPCPQRFPSRSQPHRHCLSVTTRWGEAAAGQEPCPGAAGSPLRGREAGRPRRSVTQYFFPFIGKVCAGPVGAALSHRGLRLPPTPRGPRLPPGRGGAGFLLPAGAGAEAAAPSRPSRPAAPPPQPGAGRGPAAMTGR